MAAAQGMYTNPFLQAGLQQPQTAANGMNGMLPAVSAASLPAAAQAAALPGMTHLQPRSANYPGNPYQQPILYWYPSPPVSPQSNYYVQACPTTVVVKGLPYNSQVPDVLALFEGIFEVSALLVLSIKGF